MTMIYLASKSPRRSQILKQIGVAHQILDIPSPDGEDEPFLPGELPHHYVRRTAKDKALRAMKYLQSNRHLQCLPILAADTTVVLDGQVLGKPDNLTHAATMLQQLSAKTHIVHTAVVLALPDNAPMGTDAPNYRFLENESVSRVRFKTLSDEEIARYCATQEPMGKAGSYGIQGFAALFIEHLAGSYTGVMGLPAHETGQLLAHCGQA